MDQQCCYPWKLVTVQSLRLHAHLLKEILHLVRSWVVYMHISVLRSTIICHTLSSIASSVGCTQLILFFLGQSKGVIDLNPQLVTILRRNSKSMSSCFKLIHVSRVRQITSLGYRKKFIAVIRETPSVISEESQGTIEVPFFFPKERKR